MQTESSREQRELEGVESGYFSGIAHPNRSYRYLKPGEQADIGIVKELINAAAEYHIPLEKNISSMEANWYYPEDVLEILPTIIWSVQMPILYRR